MEMLVFLLIGISFLAYAALRFTINVAIINMCQASVDAARACAIIDGIERGEVLDINNLIELPYLECLKDFKFWWRAVDDYERWAQHVIMECAARHMTVFP